ncbi:class I adenylate-forming enzyme family protein [Salinarimonas soli]|uniref:Long-chain fatty acid--CoA ligase n=1 Tax=Salinarimonas soli TaxID=1638099 RepID=A0A5B2VFJ6_9HYPH|nr:AMP-binding protein [Salinarimonas soli]KAA2237744.1 long-chain fatty acid--CoA ligase [Salinarimonas soli]
MPLTPDDVAHVRRIDDIPRFQAAAQPGAVALVQGERRLTYGTWEAAISAAAGELATRGLHPGDRMMIVAENGVVLATLCHAAARLGAWPVILNARLSAREIDTITAHAEPRLVAFATDVSVDAAGHAERFATEEIRWPELPAFLLTEPREASPEPVHDDPSRDVAALIYTSGTTGTPKGVMLSHANLLHVARFSGHLRGLAPGERVFGALPISHVFGLASVFLGTTLYGGTLYLVPRFDPAGALRLLADERLTVFQGVPAMFARLVEHADAAGVPVQAPALRYASAGGSPLDLALKARTEERLGVVLHNGYGMTELSPTVAQTRMDAPRTDDSVGPAIPGLEIRIVSADGEPLPPGAVGTLQVRGPTVMLGYYRNPAETARVLSPEGWLDTGDLARIEADGSLFIVGRAKELIIRSGFNVYPEEVEGVIGAHPDVTLCAVVGRRAADGNEEVVAFVQTRPGAAFEEAALQAWCEERLAPYKRPTCIVWLDTLPASSTGKIQKAPLRERAAGMEAGA